MNNYVMVGAGGTGTHLLRALVLYLFSHHGTDWLLHILDGDAVESKNLERQVFSPGHVTMNKAIAAAQSCDTDLVMAHPVYLAEENIERFIKDGDTVLICVDNFTVRKRIEDHCLMLDNAVVINGGNEKYDGSVQLWVRENGQDTTPRLSYLHPEIRIGEGDDRAEMTCQQAAALPGGEQTIIANLQSATWMLTALWRQHTGLHHPIEDPKPATWTELQFDAVNGRVDHIDQRMSAHWNDA